MQSYILGVVGTSFGTGVGGTAVGANAGQSAGYGFQRRYDRAYEQCMYAKGNDTSREGPPSPRR